MALSRVVSEIFNVEKYCDLKILVKGQPRSLTAGTIRYGYGFLLVFYSNFVRKIFHFKHSVTLKTYLGIRQDH